MKLFVWIAALAAISATALCESRSSLFDPEASRIRIMPQSTDARMEDIQESPDGSRLITSDRLQAPRLWDPKRQILLQILGGHRDLVTYVSFSPSGEYALTHSGTEVRIWDSLRAKLVASVKAPTPAVFTASRFAPDGQRIVTTLSDGRAWVYGVKSAANPAEIKPTSEMPMCLTVAGNQALLGTKSGKVVAFLLDGKSAAWTASASSSVINWITVNRDGTTVAATSSAGGCALIDAKTGAIGRKFEHALDHSMFRVNTMMGALWVGANQNELLTCSAAGQMRVFDPKQEKPIREWSAHEGLIREVRCTKDGHYVASYGSDEQLKIWDAYQGSAMPFEEEFGLPTAGEFGARGDCWWLGYSEGFLRRYDLKTGKAVKTTLGEVMAPAKAQMLGADQRIWLTDGASGGFGSSRSTTHFFLDVDGSRKAYSFNMNWDGYTFSPDGRYALASSRTFSTPTVLFDLQAQKALGGFKSLLFDYAFLPGDNLYTLRSELGTFVVVSIDGQVEPKGWTFQAKEDFIRVVSHPQKPLILTQNGDSKQLIMFDANTGIVEKSFGVLGDYMTDAEFTGDGRFLVVSTYSAVHAFDVESGKELWKLAAGEAGIGTSHSFKVAAKADRVIVNANERSSVFDIATGAQLFTQSRDPEKSFRCEECRLSADGQRAAILDGTDCIIVDLATKKELMRLPHLNDCETVQFITNDERIMTCDRSGSVSFWSSRPKAKAKPEDAAQPNKLGTLVAMNDGSWLVYDEDGRFDATDPSNVGGVYFVMDWEGGIEPIAMSQLKAQFYEPNLLAKILGASRESKRDVPNMDALRLYPAIDVKTDAAIAKVVTVSLKDRDQGGIGKVEVSINGKRVFSKSSTGYFKLNLEDYKSFMLPATMLPKGQGNTLAVVATNESETLQSPPVTVDIGVPAELSVPDVHLHVLCVGVSDYAGEAGDLEAPAGDARALAQAIGRVSQKLLPGKVDITTLTTTESERPTRKNILAWFDQVARQAGSSDIILAFFAGHGVSELGSQRGYFFLTSEADPGDVTAASAGTTTISADDLRQKLAAIPANKQVVILDTCHSGAAAGDLLAADRSVSGDYQRAWESIKDTTGTWLLAGAASDQKSYESGNVEHGMLTYSLLEALDKANPDGLRQGSANDELFVDVERWLSYAANRVESLKNDVGIRGIQRPEFKRSKSSQSFDLGVVDPSFRGSLGLKQPKPIVIVGSFQQEEEDPAGLEKAVDASMRESAAIKPWFDIAKHPNVFRTSGSYTLSVKEIKLKLFVQKFDAQQNRKTLTTIELNGTTDNLAELARQVRLAVEKAVGEAAKTQE